MLLRLPHSVLALDSLPNSSLPFHSRTTPVPFPPHQYRHHDHGRGCRVIPTRSRASYLSSSSSAEEPVVSVYSVLRSHGIPDDDCKAILSKFPDFFLKIRPLTTLHPKLQLLRSAGLSGPDISKVLLSNPRLLHYSLHPSLSSSITFFASVLPSKEDLLRVLKSAVCYRTDQMKANLQALRKRGASESLIRKIILLQPRSLARPTEEFVAALETIEKLGLRPTGKPFASAVIVFCYMSKKTFSRKVELLKELGWSEEQVFCYFRRRPKNLAIADELLRKKLAYFEEVLGWGPERLCLNANIMQMSLEDRIIPRCAVLNVLMMKGLLKKQTIPYMALTMSEKRFFEDYVDKYEVEVPEVLEAYQGNIEFTGWGWLKDVAEAEAVTPKSS